MYENLTGCSWIRENKQGKEYVKNADLLKALLESQENGSPTDDFTKMVILMATKISTRLPYLDEEDRNDCIEYAIIDGITYYNRFNEKKGTNAFAYMTSILLNGFAKGWRKLGKHEFPNSIMSRLDSGKIHSI
jgi:DNA-directed RNA polymerase specialized sigma subunit